MNQLNVAGDRNMKMYMAAGTFLPSKMKMKKFFVTAEKASIDQKTVCVPNFSEKFCLTTLCKLNGMQWLFSKKETLNKKNSKISRDER